MLPLPSVSVQLLRWTTELYPKVAAMSTRAMISFKLYRQVKKTEQIRYWKCCVEFCDGSAKIDNGPFSLGVSHAVGAHTDALQPSQHADSSDDDDEQLTPTAASASATSSVPRAPAAADTPLRCCEVCLLAPIEGFALVPCGLQS